MGQAEQARQPQTLRREFESLHPRPTEFWFTPRIVRQQ